MASIERRVVRPIREALHALGIDVFSTTALLTPRSYLEVLLRELAIDTVLDVGANTGQFGHELRKHIGYRDRIVSFEPTSSAYGELTANAAGDDRWIVAERCAIGAGRKLGGGFNGTG